ncbi:MAG TPA: L-histidine N(alpha)-methyltransferase [Verrucomicrobiae bacterium]
MATANVTIHASQFPENVRRDLIASLATRRVNHKFHYDSIRQTQKWLALHQAHSPSRNDADCAGTYDRAFAEAVKQIAAKEIHVIGLGCGGGQKDTRLLELLKASGREISYSPCDVSVAMTLVARQTALAVVPEKNCFPFVCDLATADDLPAAFDPRPSTLVTFFGMIPNFEPEEILPKLAALVRPQDFLLFSANLAPGADYAAGMKKIFPQYDNALTHDWLMAFLLNLGVDNGDGELRFTIETGAAGLQRVVARFHFTRDCRIAVETEKFKFRSSESIQLFFSYRYTPELVQKNLARHGLTVRAQWLTKSAEEVVFLCQQV